MVLNFRDIDFGFAHKEVVDFIKYTNEKEQDSITSKVYVNFGSWGK